MARFGYTSSRNERNDYLYCFISENLKIKIGRTWNLRLRKQQHERLHGRMELFACRSIGCDDAETLEQKIHSDLRVILETNKKSEWYEFRPLILDYFINKTGALKCYQDGGIHG